MKFKKNIILSSICLFIVTSYSSDFLVIIKKEDNKYDVVENPLWVDIEPTYTEWVETGNVENCNIWLPKIDQQKNDFSQNAECDFEEERIKSNKQQNTIDGTIKTISQETENQFIKDISFRNIEVTSNNPIQEGNNYNCDSWLPEVNTEYYGTVFEQERICDVDIMIKWNYSLNSSIVDFWEERYTEHTGLESQNANGTKKHPVYARACGYDVASECGGSKITIRDHIQGVSRGWGIMVIDPDTYSVKSYNRYDTHATPALSDNLATELNNVTSGDLVVIATYDQPAYISDNFINSMVSNLKADEAGLKMVQSEYRSSYVIISYKGGNKIEEDYGARYTYKSISANLPK